MSFLARLGVVLGLDTAEFSKGLGDAKFQLRQFETGIKTGMLAAGAAVAAATMKVIHFADEIKDTAAASDVTMSAVLEVGHALQMAGGNAENAGKVLANFNKVLGEAAMGDKAAQEMFQQLGVSLRDLENLSTEELFRKTSDSLAQLDDNGKRVALSMQAFGRGIRGVDMKGFNDGLEDGHKLTKDQEKAFADAAAAMDIFDNSIHNLKVRMVEFLGSGGASFIRFIAEGIDGIGRMVDAIANLLRKFDEWNERNSQFNEEMDAWTGRVTGESPYFKPLSEAAAEQAAPTKRKVTPYKDKSADTKLAQLLKELETLRFVSKEYETMLQQQQLGIQLETDKLNMTVNQAQVYQTIYELEKRRAEEVAKLEEKKQLAIATKADQQVIDEINKQIQAVNELTQKYSDLILKAVEYNQILTQSFEGGLLQSFQKYQFMAINTAEFVAQSVDSLFNNMSNALTSFVVNGKASFADFTKAIIADLIRIQMQMMLSQLFSAVIGFGISAATNNALGPGFVGPPAPGRAAGGDVEAGMPYYVGEAGPEMFIPKRSGTIVPNSALQNQGGTTYVTNNYIDAIDTKSFEDRLYGSSRAVWAANQYATKNISNSRTRS